MQSSVFQSNILWKGIEYFSLENCLVKSGNDGVIITSFIVGMYQSRLYRVEYTIETNADWQTTYVLLNTQLDNNIHQLHLQSDTTGNWKMNGNEAPQFAGCTDVDIPLTPFTNTLPINRLKMNIGDEQLIKVVYLDVLENSFHPVVQKYKRLSADTYQYENIPNDFEAIITVDDNGIVSRYPQLFEQVFITDSNYSLTS